jgi:hypothetical protein
MSQIFKLFSFISFPPLIGTYAYIRYQERKDNKIYNEYKKMIANTDDIDQLIDLKKAISSQRNIANKGILLVNISDRFDALMEKRYYDNSLFVPGDDKCLIEAKYYVEKYSNN